MCNKFVQYIEMNYNYGLIIHKLFDFIQKN